MARRAVSLLCLFFSVRMVFGQLPTTSKESESPIQDNSFLIEEAYNQEPGVVQHIHSFTRFWNSQSWLYSFTQEWPVPGHARHQVSYTLSALQAKADFGSGFGDLIFHYRYQLVGNGEARVAIAPRISLILPSGSSRQGTGVGGTGMQSCLPASIVLNKRMVTHLNLGGTWTPHSIDTAADRAASYGYNAGGSLIWLTSNRVNFLLEDIWSSAHQVSRPHGTDVLNILWMAPGVRWAYNFKSGLQIVPGVAYVAGIGPSSGDHGAWFYLSFEHPMWKEKKRQVETAP